MACMCEWVGNYARSKGVRKNLAEVPFRKCNEFNARSSLKCCVL